MTRLTRNLDADPDKPVELFIWNGRSVHTETTNNTGSVLLRSYLAYDADCAFCVRWVERVRLMVEARGIVLLPLATPWVRARLGLAQGQVTDRIWLFLLDGRKLGGADAVIEIGHRVGWAKPLALIAGFPGIRSLVHVGYNWIAAHRHCLGGQCTLPSHSVRKPRSSAAPRDHFFDWLPLVAMVLAVIFAMPREPAWLFMWVLAIAIFAGFKWLMFRRALRASPRTGLRTTLPRMVAFLLLWPGLDAKAVLDVTLKPAAPPRLPEFALALSKTFFGAALFFAIVRLIPPQLPLLAGWVAMVGLIFILHFGLFHLITLLWRARGIDAPMMMNNPIASQSIGEFWGRRWNRDFRVLSHEVLFQPIVRKIGGRAAAALVFLFSGLVHDLVISLPARGGYGLPTLYFMIQFAGLWFEGTSLGKRCGLGQGAIGWSFTLLITTAPILLLFHLPFVHEVILPFAQALGAW